MPTYHFRCGTCGRVFEEFSHYDDEQGIVCAVSCPADCGGMGERIWIQAPAARFDSAHDFPKELRNAARIQLGKDFATRKEHDDYCRANGYETISRGEFESRAGVDRKPVSFTDRQDLDDRIADRLDRNYNALINGELPPAQTPPPDVIAEIKETAAQINKQVKGATA